jgi:hypothetical protein
MLNSFSTDLRGDRVILPFMRLLFATLAGSAWRRKFGRSTLWPKLA